MSPVLFRELKTSNNRKIAIAELHAPQSLNALSLSMIELLLKQLYAWQSDDEIAMVLLQGAGDKAFCAGGDVVSLYQALKSERVDGETVEHAPVIISDQVIVDSLAMKFFSTEYQLDQLIHQFTKPILVWGDGYIIGGGMGLFAGASHRVVTERSLLAMPEITIGLYPDVGASWFLNKVPQNIGLFLAMTGAMFNASDAKYIGLADVIVNSADQQEILARLQTVTWQDEQSNADLLSQVLTEFSENSGVELVSKLQQNEALISDLTSYNNAIDVYQAIIKANFQDKWLKSAQNKLRAGSPLSALLIFKQLALCKNLSLAECFSHELNLSLRCCQFPEFSEGVRALLVDKDKNPIWRYENITEIPDSTLDWFFTAITS